MPNYTQMSETELHSMIEEASKALKEKQQGKRKEVLAKIRELAASIGVTVEIVEAPKVAARKGGVVPIKYQNPNNPAEKWSGRGVKPRWLQNFLNQGRRIEEFEVKP